MKNRLRLSIEFWKHILKFICQNWGANTDTLFVDCHGGCGVYIDDKKNLNSGSSIRVYQACEQVFSKRRTKNYIAKNSVMKKV